MTPKPRTAVPEPGADPAYDAATTGAIEMARHWLRFQEATQGSARHQLERELFTISRALVLLANRADARRA